MIVLDLSFEGLCFYALYHYGCNYSILPRLNAVFQVVTGSPETGKRLHLDVGHAQVLICSHPSL